MLAKNPAGLHKLIYVVFSGLFWAGRGYTGFSEIVELRRVLAYCNLLSGSSVRSRVKDLKRN